jgi:flagellar protein FliO/FliZ
MGLRGLPTGRSTLVKVIERIPLDPKRSLFVVQAAGEYLLIGGGDDGLNLLGKLDAAEVERVLDQQLKQTPQMSPFLQKLLSRKGSTPPADKV